MGRSNKDRKASKLRAGHLHSPPVNKQAIVDVNMVTPLSRLDRRSFVASPLSKALAKSPTQGAYVPIFGAGQGKKKPHVTPKLKRKWEGAKIVKPVPERPTIHANGKRDFRPFNATGKA